jgi:hypothetical protein
MTSIPDEPSSEDILDESGDATLDTDFLEDRRDAEASPADLVDQAIDIPFDEEDRA